MKSKKVNYEWPESIATKRGTFFVSFQTKDPLNSDGKVWSPKIKFTELTKCNCDDSVSEIDYDFPFQENISIPCVRGRKDYDLTITLNLN